MMRILMLACSVLTLAGCGGSTGLTGEGDSSTDTTLDVPDRPEWCPPTWPDPGSECEVEGAVCEYGSETCCGVTHPSYVCQCGGGVFGCYYTDACMGAPMGCPCGVDEDCEGGYGYFWCEGGSCGPCDDSGRTCGLWCPHGFVPPRNGCQPCICAETPCTMVGEGYCTCDAGCGEPGLACEVGLGRCVEDFCAVADCAPGTTCDQLRGCVPGECDSAEGCKLLYSTCGCQAVPATDPRDSLDPCDFDGGDVCGVNSCEVDRVRATCRSGLCTEEWGEGCGG